MRTSHSSIARAKFVGRALLRACAAIALYALIVPAQAVTYTVFDVPGATATFAVGINNAGVIAGYHYTAAPGTTQHGFVRAADGTFSLFEPHGSIWMRVAGINENGQVVGTFEDKHLTNYAFIRSPNGHILTVPGPRGAYGLGINGQGDICGYSYEVDNSVHGFVRTADGTFSEFDPPGSFFTEALAINDDGSAVGFFEDAHSALNGFLRKADGTVEVVNISGSGATVPTSINADGIIAGTYLAGDGYRFFIRYSADRYAGFSSNAANAVINDATEVAGDAYRHGERFRSILREPEGKIKSIKLPGAYSVEAAGINNGGAIVGTFENRDFVRHGFLRTP